MEEPVGANPCSFCWVRYDQERYFIPSPCWTDLVRIETQVKRDFVAVCRIKLCCPEGIQISDRESGEIFQLNATDGAHIFGAITLLFLY